MRTGIDPRALGAPHDPVSGELEWEFVEALIAELNEGAE